MWRLNTALVRLRSIKCFRHCGAPSARRLSGGEIGPITLKLVYEAADGYVSIVLVGPTKVSHSFIQVDG